MKLFNSIHPLTLCFALGACVTSGTVEYVVYDAVGGTRLFKSVAASGTFPIVVHGNPTGNAKAMFDNAVIDAMGDYVWG